MKEIGITTEFIKLDQFLKWAGIAESGSHAKEIIFDGNVRVNGEVVTQRGKKLHKGDTVSIENMGEFIIV